MHPVLHPVGSADNPSFAVAKASPQRLRRPGVTPALQLDQEFGGGDSLLDPSSKKILEAFHFAGPASSPHFRALALGNVPMACFCKGKVGQNFTDSITSMFRDLADVA